MLNNTCTDLPVSGGDGSWNSDGSSLFINLRHDHRQNHIPPLDLKSKRVRMADVEDNSYLIHCFFLVLCLDCPRVRAMPFAGG